MQTIRCNGRQIQAISEQVKSDDQSFVLTQMEDSNKLAVLPLEQHEGEGGYVFDPQGREHTDLWSTATGSRATAGS